jgi:hypothetical protein
MDPELERVLKSLEDASEFAATYRFELTHDYLALIEAVEAMPGNQPGADKSGRWLGGRAHARVLLAGVERSSPDR